MDGWKQEQYQFQEKDCRFSGRYQKWEVQSAEKILASGYHYHEVTADNEETLDMVEHVLKEKGIPL